MGISEYFGGQKHENGHNSVKNRRTVTIQVS